MKRKWAVCKICGSPCLGGDKTCIECKIKEGNKKEDSRFTKKGEYTDKLDDITGEKWL